MLFSKFIQKTQAKRRAKGATMIEYALVFAAVVAIATALFFDDSDDSLGTVGTAINSKISGAVGS